MRNACDADSRCGLLCDASARDAKSLAMWVERCEPLSISPRDPAFDKKNYNQAKDSKFLHRRVFTFPSFPLCSGSSLEGENVCKTLGVASTRGVGLAIANHSDSKLATSCKSTTSKTLNTAGCSGFGNGPKTFSESTVSNTELSEFFGPPEFRGESSVSSSQPIICLLKRSHRASRRTQ